LKKLKNLPKNGLFLNSEDTNGAVSHDNKNGFNYSPYCHDNNTILSSRKSFFFGLAGTMMMSTTMSSAAAATDMEPSSSIMISRSLKPKKVPVPEGATIVSFQEFCSLLQSNKLQKVTLANDGFSLLSMDKDGALSFVEQVPDDPKILNELLNHKVDYALTEFVVPEKLDTARWIWKKISKGK